MNLEEQFDEGDDFEKLLGNLAAEFTSVDESAYHIFTSASKDAVLFCIDCQSVTQMFRDSRIFRRAVSTVYSFMRSKIIASDGSDQTGLVLYNVGKTDNPLRQGGICVVQPLGLLTASRIRTLNELANISESDFAALFGGSGSADVSELLFVCNAEFKKASPAYRPRMFIFTNDDNPCGSDLRAKKAAHTRANDFHEGLSNGADISVIPIVEEGVHFDVGKFWDKIVLYSADFENKLDDSDLLGESSEDQFVSNAIIQLSEMNEVILKKVFKKRPLNRMDMLLNGFIGPKIAFMAYTSYYSASKPKQIYVDARTSVPLQGDTKLVSELTGAVLDEQKDVRTVFGAKNGIFVEISKEEINLMKQYVSDGELAAASDVGGPIGVSGLIELIGFADSAKYLRPDFCVGHGYFLYPQDSRVVGSGVVTSALIDTMVDRRLVGICRFVAKKNSSVCLAVLVPQAEVIDPESNRQECSPGFHLLRLPYAEDVRKLTLVDTNVGYQMAQDVAWEKTRQSQVEAAAKIVDAMFQPHWEPDMLDSPSMQQCYLALEAMALELPASEITPPTDLVHPDPAKVAAAKEFCKEFLQSINLETTEQLSLGGGNVKKERMYNGGIKTEFSSCSRPEAGTQKVLSLDDIRQAVNMGVIETYTLDHLKAIIRGLPERFPKFSFTAKRKHDLIEKIRENIYHD